MELIIVVGVGLILLGFICQVIGSCKFDGNLILDGFLLQALAFFLAIPFLA